MQNADHIHFILVEPRSPGNVGAAARAIKTMGFSRLWLVNPCDINDDDARKMAHASHDILDQARVFDSLEAALADMHFVVATSNRMREDRWPTFTPEEVGQKFLDIAPRHRVAIVFGREKSGLTNEELRQCHAISTAPVAITHPSLNLAQAVMLYAYALHRAAPTAGSVYDWEYAHQTELESVYLHLEETLKRIGFVPLDSWERFVMRFKRLFGRAHPEVRDVGMMHKILQAMDEYVKYGGKNK